jgi:hypothetical protein
VAAPPLDSPCDGPVTYPGDTKILEKSSERSGPTRKMRQTEYQNKHYNINQKDEGTYEGRGRDGGTNCIWRIKEQETCLTLHEHDGDDDDDDDV